MLSVLSTGVDGDCGPPTVTWTSYGDYCYHFSNETRNFAESKKACEDFAANLTSIPGEVEMEFMIDG